LDDEILKRAAQALPQDGISPAEREEKIQRIDREIAVLEDQLTKEGG